MVLDHVYTLNMLIHIPNTPAEKDEQIVPVPVLLTQVEPVEDGLDPIRQA